MISSLASLATVSLPDTGMARPTGPQNPAMPGSGSFSKILSGYISSAAETMKAAETAAAAGIEGKIPLQSMVDQILSAERTLQTTIAIRDKVVSSYLEISRMQI